MDHLSEQQVSALREQLERERAELLERAERLMGEEAGVELDTGDRQDVAAAEAQTLEFLKRHCAAGGSPLCGNSIGQDRRFIVRYMPALAEFLHYRSVDVSSVKEIARRWYPEALAAAPAKAESHRALDDIRESIAELLYYRRTIFR